MPIGHDRKRAGQIRVTMPMVECHAGYGGESGNFKIGCKMAVALDKGTMLLA